MHSTVMINLNCQIGNKRFICILCFCQTPCWVGVITFVWYSGKHVLEGMIDLIAGSGSSLTFYHLFAVEFVLETRALCYYKTERCLDKGTRNLRVIVPCYQGSVHWIHQKFG